jgi:hypothetical protein
MYTLTDGVNIIRPRLGIGEEATSSRGATKRDDTNPMMEIKRRPQQDQVEVGSPRLDWRRR